MPRVITSLSREDLAELFEDLPKLITGEKRTNKLSVYKVFWGTVAHSLFTSIYEAYLQKSQGEQDDLGNSWKDLTQEYKAYHKKMGSETARKYKRRYKSNTLGLLSPTEYKQWKTWFGRVYHAKKKSEGEEKAKAMAGKVAWGKAKAAGAPTMLDILGNRNLAINIDTKRLILSLKPGKHNSSNGYKKSHYFQVFSIHNGVLTIGTRVAYSEYVNAQRPFIPEDVDLWVDRAVQLGTEALANELIKILQR